MLYDLSATPGSARLVHSGALARHLRLSGQRLTAGLEGPQDCILATALRQPARPASVTVTDAEGGADLLVWSEHDAGAGVLRLRHRSPRTRAELVVTW